MLFTKNLLLLASLFIAARSYSQVQLDTSFYAACSESGYLRYLPHAFDSVQIVIHENYALGYSEEHEQPLWVAYVLSASECTGEEERESSFYTDPMVKTGSAANADYLKSGYDRGHLAPAGDMGFSKVAMKESFYYSNMSPQLPSFNRGIWKKLETQVRDWAKEYGSLLIITGPLFLSDTLPKIGPNKVTVPSAYYKVVVKPDKKNPQIICFLLWNKESDQPLNEYVYTVDKVEQLTNILFFPVLKIRNLESKVKARYWSNMGNKIYFEAPRSQNKVAR